MAKTRVNGRLGAVAFDATTLPQHCDFARWSMQFTHPLDDDTSYSDNANNTSDPSQGSSHYGSGVVDYALSASGFLYADVGSSSPGFSTATNAAAIHEAGGSVTVTAFTGCTLAATFILSGGSIDHQKRIGAVPVGYQGLNRGNLTEVWATS